jgi:hypothetical protein
LDDLILPLGELHLESIDGLACLHELRSQVTIFLKQFLVESLLLLIDPLIIG